MAKLNIQEIKEIIKNGVDTIDDAIENLTDEEQEKVIADAILDMVEELASTVKRPAFVGMFLKFATSRFRSRYDIPDND